MKPRPTHGLPPAARPIFWRLYAACGQINSAEVDLEEHCRNIALTILEARVRAA